VTPISKKQLNVIFCDYKILFDLIGSLLLPLSISFRGDLMKAVLAVAFSLVVLLPYQSQAADFAISFEWLKSSKCSGGYPDVEKNPKFELSNVPSGTKTIKFIMDDQDAAYYHGGGTVEYSGQTAIESGAFKYEGPCPPFTHTYVWTATAKDADGKTLARAKAKRKFPE